MSAKYISIEATPEIIEEIRQASTSNEVRISSSAQLDSPADALDAPLGADEIKQICEVVTVIFSTATAGVTFIGTVLNVLKNRKGSSATIKDPATGETKGVISDATTVDEAKGIMAI